MERRGKGTILVMDDERGIRDITTKMLQTVGYETMEAKEGSQAVDILKQDTDHHITAALFDLTVHGGMGGKDAAKQIRDLRPDLPIFASSGYSFEGGASGLFTASISKPYRMQDLVTLLDTYL
ncbi:MAG: response regulator [Spirochaetota bacterium]